MAAIYSGLQSNGTVVTDVAAQQDMAAITWDPERAATSTVAFSAYTSGTPYLTKLLYPMDRVSTIGYYFGATGWSGQTSLGFVLYSADGAGSDMTTLTKIATVDITSANNSSLDHRVSFTTVTGLTPGHAVYVAFLQVGATAGTMMQDAGGDRGTAANIWWTGTAGLRWCTAGLSGLANLAAMPSTIAASALVSSSVAGPPCYGLRP